MAAIFAQARTRESWIRTKRAGVRYELIEIFLAQTIKNLDHRNNCESDKQIDSTEGRI